MAYLGLARKWRPQILLISSVRAHRSNQRDKKITHQPGLSYTELAASEKLRPPEYLQKPSLSTPVSPGVPCNNTMTALKFPKAVRSMFWKSTDFNNGVDAVREFEDAKYLPSTGTSKIYIIDEVHMLATAAFNALLKTLEEPPAPVILFRYDRSPENSRYGSLAVSVLISSAYPPRRYRNV